MLLDWISHDTHLSKYLVIFGWSAKMDLILWIFHGNAKVRIYWSSQKCPYLVYLLQGAFEVSESTNLSSRMDSFLIRNAKTYLYVSFKWNWQSVLSLIIPWLQMQRHTSLWNELMELKSSARLVSEYTLYSSEFILFENTNPG